MQTKEKKPVHVAVAVISDTTGRFLLSRRDEQVHGGGFWEFPGGKLEPGESLSHALCREVHEELGLEILDHRPLIQITHHYPDRTVQLDVHRVTRFKGRAEGVEGQPLAWVTGDELDQYELLPADRPIVSALQLPDCYLITGADPTKKKQFLMRLKHALERGVKLVQLRAKSLSELEYCRLAEPVLKLCHCYEARLLLNASPALAAKLGADGIHLTGQQLHTLHKRPLGSEYMVGASCHSASDLIRAARLGLDFALLSPVLLTASHPLAQPLGWSRFAAWVEPATLPVYALGGMRPDMIAEAQRHGAQGIAGISGLWKEGLEDAAG